MPTTKKKTMLKELDTYNWQEAFKYSKPERIPTLPDIDLSPFDREDVAEIAGIAEGEGDGDDWVIYGRLVGGRWFCLRAWCDYTGWG